MRLRVRSTPLRSTADSMQPTFASHMLSAQEVSLTFSHKDTS